MDRVLGGAQPRNFPVAQPTQLELVKNPKNSRAIGQRKTLLADCGQHMTNATGRRVPFNAPLEPRARGDGGAK